MAKSLEAEYQETLHQALDALVADFIYKTGKLPSSITVTELIEWSKEQVPNYRPNPHRLTNVFMPTH